MTTQEAKDALGVKTDTQLAAALGLTRGAVHNWGGTVPKLRRYEIQEIVAGMKKPLAPE